MKRRMVFISEALSAPFDEGLKNVIFNTVQSFIKRKDTLVVTKAGNSTDGMDVRKVKLNKLFINKELMSLLKRNLPKIILYVPEASCTFNSFIRGKLLKIWSSNAKVVILCAQHREYSTIKSAIISKFLKPDLLLLLGKRNEKYYLEKGMKVRVLPPAVDCVKFNPATDQEKKRIRTEHKIPDNKTVVLHVGHIKTGRNIECLVEIQKINNMQVVVVGSTSTDAEQDLKNKLLDAGVIVVDSYIRDISTMYKMSDVYVFPVMDYTNAIDMSLSVLEAMACNLPVVTTKFGCLADNFEENANFRYFHSEHELIEIVTGMNTREINNNKRVEPYTWDRFSDKIIAACEELI